jgi:hypothetical protein
MKEPAMTGQAQLRRRGSYGIDAPYAFAAIGVVIVVDLVMTLIGAINSGQFWLLLPALFLVIIAAFVPHSTLRGKFVVWAELLDRLNLRGDERILDLVAVVRYCCWRLNT